MSTSAVPNQRPPGASHWETVERYLLAEKRRIIAEIRDYPSPIAGCDAQFNYLLEQRNQINAELTQAHDRSRHPELGNAALLDFVAGSSCLRLDTKRAMLNAIPT